MERVKIEYTDFFPQVMDRMTNGGLLVGAYDPAGKPNIMTIGWGFVGSSWGIPLWNILVRPSRHTHEAIEHTGCFTVNVPDDSLSLALATCGSKSGRDHDKFKLCNLTPQRAGNVLAPTVAECPIVYECQVVHSNDIEPAKLSQEILTGAYVDGDYHRIYYGKILAAYAAPDAAERLKRIY